MSILSLRNNGLYIAPRRRPGGPGFTIVEVLVMLGLLAILLSIVMSVLGAGRAASRQTMCIANTRTHMLLMSAYAADYKDFWPYPMLRDRGESDALTVDGEPYALIPERALDRPGIFVLPALYHAAMLSHGYEGRYFHPTLICPSNRGLVEHVAANPGVLGTHSYTMSLSMFFMPEGFDPAWTPPAPHPLLHKSAWRGTRIADVRFPAQKAALFEAAPFHDPALNDGHHTSSPPWRPVVAAADGSARVRPTGTTPTPVQLPSYAPAPAPLRDHLDAFHNTAWGIRGRDW